MLKVGQIYNVPYLGGKIAVTWIRADKHNFSVIRIDGFCFICSEPDFKWELIAEYPTWQEAINSEYFKND